MKRFRDFYSKTYKNPFFTRQKRSRIKFFVMAFFIVAVLAGIVYLVIYSPLFKIKKIQVSGNKQVESGKIISLVQKEISGYQLVWPKDNSFFINSSEIEGAIKAIDWPIRTVTVSGGLDKLEVKVDEIQAVARLLGTGESYLVNQDGKVMRIAAPGEGENLLAVSFIDSSRVFNVGDLVLSSDQLKFMNQLHQYFATQVGIRDRLFTIDEAGAAVNVWTIEDWYAIFDPGINLDDQFKTLSLALQNKFNPDERKNILYIDARFGDRVFYKER